MERYNPIFERTSLNKLEVNFLMKFDKALNLLQKSKSYIITEATVRDSKNFNITLKQSNDILYEITNNMEDIVTSSLEDFSLTFAVEVIYRYSGHKFTNFMYTYNVKDNLKSLIIDLDNMIRNLNQDILLGSIKSEYFKMGTSINDFIIEYNKKFTVKNYKELLRPYEEINYFNKR